MVTIVDGDGAQLTSSVYPAYQKQLMKANAVAAAVALLVAIGAIATALWLPRQSAPPASAARS